MAGKRMTRGSLGLILLVVLALLVGCGIKSPPLESTKVAPMAVGDLAARTLSKGVEVSFSVPAADKPDNEIKRALLFYGYLPVTGDPECPPCPPRLRQFHDLDVGQRLGKLEGGRFVYLDTQAPMDSQAIYQVVVVDARGRKSSPSYYARALRAELPAAPAGLTVAPGDAQAKVTWQPVQNLASGKPSPDSIGYILYRKGPDGERALNTRPLTRPELLDKSVTPGGSYAYRAAAVRLAAGSQIEGPPSGWVSTRPLDLEPPSTPQGLVGAGLKDGIYLRFTPSPEQDTAGYIIERAAGRQGPWSRLNPELCRENTYVDKDVKVDGVYHYRVTAQDEAGNLSKPSESVEVKQQP